MKYKNAISIISSLSVMILLTGCGIQMPDNAKAQDRLQSMLQHLPIPPGAVLVGRANTSLSGQMAGCQGNIVESFYGTNDMSFQQVMDLYATSLKAQGWTLHSEYSFGLTFMLGEFSADVSDRVDVSSIGLDLVQKGKSTYRTVYLLNLYTSDLVPVPSQCKGG